MRVLVIDREVAAARSLAALIRNENHQVDVAHDEKAALQKAGRLHPKLAFLAVSERHEHL
jgi:DNA-binding response OmpR family regulator